LALIVIITFLVAGNNMIIAAGPLIGSRILKKNSAILIGVAGGLAGFVLQGGYMIHIKSALYSNTPDAIVILGFEIVIFMFILSTIFRYPLSLNIVTTFVFLGASFALNTKINYLFLAALILFWIATFFVSVGLVKIMAFDKIKDLWNKIYIFKMLTIILSFFAAFAWGSNTLGFIYAISGGQYYYPILISTVVGGFLLGTVTIKKVIESSYMLKYSAALKAQIVQTLLVETATVFSFPLSSTQALSYGLYSVGMDKKRFINSKPLIFSIVSMIVFAILSFLMLFLIVHFFIK
jgi:PiT family inorganic phosphate transporter